MPIKLKSLLSESFLAEIGSKDFIRILTDLGFQFADTPQTSKELEQLFHDLPPNSEIVFFDYNGLITPADPKNPDSRKYAKGIPPLLKYKKELNNVEGKIIFVQFDNRGGDGVIMRQDQIPNMALAVFRQKNLLNKYGVKTYKESTPNLPRGIGHRRTTTINALDR